MQKAQNVQHSSFKDITLRALIDKHKREFLFLAKNILQHNYLEKHTTKNLRLTWVKMSYLYLLLKHVGTLQSLLVLENLWILASYITTRFLQQHCSQLQQSKQQIMRHACILPRFGGVPGVRREQKDTLTETLTGESGRREPSAFGRGHFDTGRFQTISWKSTAEGNSSEAKRPRRASLNWKGHK